MIYGRGTVTDCRYLTKYQLRPHLKHGLDIQHPGQASPTGSHPSLLLQTTSPRRRRRTRLPSRPRSSQEILRPRRCATGCHFQLSPRAHAISPSTKPSPRQKGRFGVRGCRVNFAQDGRRCRLTRNEEEDVLATVGLLARFSSCPQ